MQAWIAFHNAQDLQPIHLGQFQIQKDHLRRDISSASFIFAARKQEVQSFCTIFHMKKLVGKMLSLQCTDGQLCITWVVFHEQNFHNILIHHDDSPYEEEQNKR